MSITTSNNPPKSIVSMLRNAATKINHRFLHYTAKTIFSLGAGDPNKNYITQGPPTVWKNIALIGHATSSGPINPDLKGKVTAFNRTNGEKLWSFTNTVGPRIQHENATKNGGAPIWTG